MDKSRIRIVSIIPYKILPAKLGGEKGIALFNEYLGRIVTVTGIATRNNEAGAAKNYRMLNILSNSRTRYINVFLYFRIRKIILQEQATHLLIEHPYFAWLAWLLRKTMPVTWVIHSHNIEYMRSKSIGRSWWRLLMAYERWAYQKADKVFFISEEDREHAIRYLHTSAAKSSAITYGIEQDKLPSDAEIAQCKKEVCQLHGIDPGDKILLFNGALYHSTNYDALSVILEKINPLLLEKQELKYTIIVCGKGLPDFFNELKEYKMFNIIYAGFVDDISIYFKSVDIFLNPILSGGGVKTKAIEAMAMNCTVVSTELGAMGIRTEVCGKKIHIIKDNNWADFAAAITDAMQKKDVTPPEFFNHYYWGNVVERAVEIIS